MHIRRAAALVIVHTCAQWKMTGFLEYILCTNSLHVFTLSRNILVQLWNLLLSQVDDFLNNEAKGTKIVGAHSMEEMVAKLKKPRRVMLLVKAGKPVDAFIEQLVPLLDRGDIIIDGGNSEYQDTQR